MQQHSLLATKLYIPPVRPDPSSPLRTGLSAPDAPSELGARLVSRPRLLERLEEGLTRRLTVVSAPAGFGKTTLVSEWVHMVGTQHAAPLEVAWLSLDEGDNDPARFLAYLVAALQTIEANIGKGVLSALQSPGVADATTPPSTEAVLIPLINEIAAIPRSIVLVLDDHHTIESASVDNALGLLLDRLPPQMHLVIATREDPRLPLARLRAQGQLTELRASDLRFTLSEAAEFLNRVMGLDLSAEEIAALETRTEGWIAGLHLAALALQGLALQGLPMQGHKDTSSFIKSFTGSHRFVLDYLIEEVLEQQTESVQTFLLQTSVLNRLTGSLCDAVRFGGAKSPSTPQGDAVRFGAPETPTGQDHGQATLEMLERANLFIIPLDEERRWYRYHHLFSDLLRQRLRQTQPEQVPALHHRASAWYEQNGFLDEAIEHALHAVEFERVAYLIEEHVDTLWQRGEHTKLRRWLAGLPVELVFSRPHLCILRAWDLFTSGQQDLAEQSLQAAERALDARPDGGTEASPPERGQLPDSDKRKIRGRAAAIRAFLAFYRGDAQRTREYARQALELLPEEDMTWRSTATVALGDAYSFVGDLAEAYQVRLDALEASKAAGNIYMMLIAGMKLAVTLRSLGRLERVIALCRQQLRLANESGLSRTVVVGGLLAIWGEVLAERNDLDGAIEKARKGIELTEGGRDVAMLGWSYLCLVRILFSRGDLAGAQAAIQRMETMAAETYVPPWITDQMAGWQARTWLVQGDLDAASQWAAEGGLDAGADPAYLREMEYTVLARILVARGRLDEVARLLQHLLESAEPRGQASRVIEILNLQALASQAGGEPDRAMTALERALTLAEPEGFVRIFVDEGPPMARLLYEAASRGISPDYACRLLAAFPVAGAEQTGLPETRAPEPDLVEPLSERELEVLQLVAEGLTNREVASRLFLSLNTVKAHTRNIYGKLNVHSRTQAIARSQELGLLAHR